MRTPERMTCDVCGCSTDHLTIGKDGKPDECQRCYWSRCLDVAALREENEVLRGDIASDIGKHKVEVHTLREQVATLTVSNVEVSAAFDELLVKHHAALADVERLTKELNNYRGIVETGLEIEQGLREENSGHVAGKATLYRRIAKLAHDSARHLAVIETLEQALANAAYYVEPEHAEEIRATLAGYAKKADEVEGPSACPHGARTWNVIDQTMRCKACDAKKPGGAR